MAEKEKVSPPKLEKKETSSGSVAMMAGGKDVTDKGGGGGGSGSKTDSLPLPIPRNMETPDGLELKRSGIDHAKLGVWCTKPIKEGAVFGPFQGEKVTKTRKDSDPVHVWEIVDLETKEFLFYVDATRPEYSNWMRYTQCARCYEEQNIIAQQEGIDIMYQAIKAIKEGEELLTWYKMPSPKRGQRQAGRTSGGRAKCQEELDMSCMDHTTITPTASPSPSGKKKSTSPSKSKPNEDKAKTESKDTEAKLVKSESDSVSRKGKQTEGTAASAKVGEVKVTETKAPKTKQGKVKQGEAKSGKVTQGEGKQSESEVKSEDKSAKVKAGAKSDVKVKSAMVKSEAKTVKVKPTEVKSTEVKSEVKAKLVKSEAKAAKVDPPAEIKKTAGKDKTIEVMENEVKDNQVKLAEVKESKENVMKESPEQEVSLGKAVTKPDGKKPKEASTGKPECQSKESKVTAKELQESSKSAGKEPSGRGAEARVDKLAKAELPIKFQVKGSFPRGDDIVDDLDDDHEGDELEIDLGDESDVIEDEDLENESDDSKMDYGKNGGLLDCSKNSALLDPEKYQFELKKDHIAKSRYGRKVFKCDICSGIYRHAFSLKRHYIRNHINLKFVSRADILNCQINPDVHNQALTSEKSGEKRSHEEGEEGVSEAGKEKDEEEEEGCDRASHELSLDVPGRSVDTPCDYVLDTLGTDISDSKSLSICSDNSTEDEATQGLSKLLLQKAESAVNGGEVKEEVISSLYRCNVCSMLFDNTSSLRLHLENHPNMPSSKAFACDKCDMKFSHKQNLMRHLAVHTGEKPFVCKVCGKKFPTATNQKRHERIHLGRRISCDYCTSTFTQSGDLKKHIRKLHPECFHECAFCGKYFTDEEELSDHVTSHNESLRSNEEESNRRRDAFKVNMEIDRLESMRLAEQKTPGFKFACTVCKKRFHDYANMCRHRRLAHQRHLLISQGSTSSSPLPSPTKLPSDHSDTDPQAFFYANIANKISENLNNYIEGTKDDIVKAASQIKRDLTMTSEMSEKGRTKIKQEKKDMVNYNFPTDFSPRENYRKVVGNEDEVARILATDLKIVQQKEPASKAIDVKKVFKGKDSPKCEEKCVPDISLATEKIGDSVSELMAAELKVIQTLTDLKKMDEANRAQAAMKAVDLKVPDKVINLKVSKEDIDAKPLIPSVVNGVSLNIPVFNVSSLARKEVKVQPVCTVQPIQRQSPAEPPKHSSALPHSTKCPPPSSTDKPKASVPKAGLPEKAAKAALPERAAKAALHEKAAKAAFQAGSGKSPPSLKSLPAAAKTSPASAFSLKIPQVRVCPVCRRLFNNDLMYRQHMVEKHKTSPEEASLKEKEVKEIKSENDPVMDLSAKSSPPAATAPVKARIDHDEGARLLLDFALGVQEEVSRTIPAVTTPPPPDSSAPLDLSGLTASPQPRKASVFGRRSVCPSLHSQSPVKAPAAHYHSPPNAHTGPHNQPQAAHSTSKIPAAHTGNHGNNKQAKLHGVLSIPPLQLSTDADLPAPLVTPPSMPKSPWQPQFPASFGPKMHAVKKYICTVCYSEFRSRSLLFSHQRAVHPNVRCDHVEVDSDVVAPWWQKPSPVGMLNVCSSQVADLNPAQQKSFICTKCSKKFTSTGDLHSHILECADKIKKRPKLLPKPSLNQLHTTQPAVTAAISTTATALASTKPEFPVSNVQTVIRDVAMGTVGKTEDTPASATSTRPDQPSTQQQQQQLQPQPVKQGQSKLAKMKTSMLKRLKKRKIEVEEAGVVNKKKRRNPELLYNPQNHVRRREMTEVLDMQVCRGCGQHFSTISLLERHIPLCAEKDRLKTLQVSRTPLDVLSDGSERNLCRYCHKQFTYTGMLRKHVFDICQMRKTRIQEGSHLDEEWEQEIGQYHSSSASLETCSNDGSHLDDAASTAASTSSHDTDSSNKNRRKRRKNRGWGNSKKKRSPSEGTDPTPESVDETWNADGEADVTGSEAAGNEEEEEEDDDFDGCLSDGETMDTINTNTEVKSKSGVTAEAGPGARLGSQAVSQSMRDDTKIYQDKSPNDQKKEGPQPVSLSLIHSTPPSVMKTSDKPPVTHTSDKPLVTHTSDKPSVTQTSDKLTVIQISEKPAVTQNLDKPSTIQTLDKPPVSAQANSQKPATQSQLPEKPSKTPVKPMKETEAKKMKNKSEISASTLPFVLSVPQYTERVPQVKAKMARPGHCEKQVPLMDSKKKKMPALKDGTKKAKLSSEPVNQKAAPGFPATKETDKTPTITSKIDEKIDPKIVEETPKPALSDLAKGMSSLIEAIIVKEKQGEADMGGQVVRIQPSPAIHRAVNIVKVPSQNLAHTALAVAPYKVSTSVIDVPQADKYMKQPSGLSVSQVETGRMKYIEEHGHVTTGVSEVKVVPGHEMPPGGAVVKVVSVEDMKKEEQKRVDWQKVDGGVLPQSAPAVQAPGNPSSTLEEGDKVTDDNLVDPASQTDSKNHTLSQTSPIESKSESKREDTKVEDSDDSSDEEDIKEYINTFLAARGNRTNTNKGGKAKAAAGGAKVQASREKDTSVVSPKTSPVKNASKKEGRAKKLVVSPKKVKSTEKLVDSVKGKALKKAAGVAVKSKSPPAGGSSEEPTTVSPVKKKPGKAKAVTKAETDANNDASKASKENLTKSKNTSVSATPEEVVVSGPSDKKEGRDDKTISPQSKPKKKTADEGGTKASPKTKATNKGEKQKTAPESSPESSLSDKKEGNTPKAKKAKTSTDSPKPDEKTSKQAGEGKVKKDKTTKGNVTSKSSKCVSPKKPAQNKAEEKQDPEVSRNRKRKSELEGDGANKAKGGGKGTGEPPAKIARTRGLVSKSKETESEDKPTTGAKVTASLQRRETRSTPVQDPQTKAAAAKVKASRMVKKEGAGKMKRSLSMLTRKVNNDDKSNKTRAGQVVPKPMRTRQSRHSL